MHTIDEMMRDAGACTTKEQAEELVRKEVAALTRENPMMLDEEARAIVAENIGYMTGYMERAEAARILKLFETTHPYLGAIQDWPKAAEEIIEIGYKVGMRAREAREARERQRQ